MSSISSEKKILNKKKYSEIFLSFSKLRRRMINKVKKEKINIQTKKFKKKFKFKFVYILPEKNLDSNLINNEIMCYLKK